MHCFTRLVLVPYSVCLGLQQPLSSNMKTLKKNKKSYLDSFLYSFDLVTIWPTSWFLRSFFNQKIYHLPSAYLQVYIARSSTICAAQADFFSTYLCYSNTLNQWYLVSISKNVVFYASLVIRIYQILLYICKISVGLMFWYVFSHSAGKSRSFAIASKSVSSIRPICQHISITSYTSSHDLWSISYV